MIRKCELYPDYCAELEEIERNGINETLLLKIINDHSLNSYHTKKLYGRYRTLDDDIPIFSRHLRFNQEDDKDIINNKLNNDFFSEIIDIKVGYYAGKPAIYSYGDSSDEMSEDTKKNAIKLLKDFIKRNNMYDIDMETTKYASICGYAGRLFYIDTEGNIRVMVLPPFETIILYKNEMTEPSYAVRYYECQRIDDSPILKVEFYDEKNIYYYEGDTGHLDFIKQESHLFDMCPLQGVPNNKELMGDTEKVIALIDDYDRSISDNSNDIETFSNAYMVFKNAKITDETADRMNETGLIEIDVDDPNAPYDVSYLTKNIDASFTSSHLDRLENNIYRFSKSPNLNDPKFSASTGIALKIKMTGLETKCGMFQAKHNSANNYMFKLLQQVYNKKSLNFDAMECNVTYKRNFPIDFLGDAQAVQALVSCGLPKQVAFRALSFIDDVDEILKLIEDEKENIDDLDIEEDDDQRESEDDKMKMIKNYLIKRK